MERGTTNSSDFAWMSQMRFYYDERDGGSLEMRLLQARVSYAFEYLGNATRLVITPLTERCFRFTCHSHFYFHFFPILISEQYEYAFTGKALACSIAEL